MKKHQLVALVAALLVTTSIISYKVGSLFASFNLNAYYSRKFLALETVIYDRLKTGDCEGTTRDLKTAIVQTYTSYEVQMDVDPLLNLISGNESPDVRIQRQSISH